MNTNNIDELVQGGALKRYNFVYKTYCVLEVQWIHDSTEPQELAAKISSGQSYETGFWFGRNRESIVSVECSQC